MLASGAESAIVGATSENIRPVNICVVKDFVVSRELESISTDEGLPCLYP